MCRMIIGLGKLHTTKLIDDLILMAKGRNKLHEKNSELGEFTHEDGWGLAYLNKNDRWVTYKSIKPVYEDENLPNFRRLKTNGIILHARRATAGEINFENTQPFYFEDDSGEYVFTHNGTIMENIPVKTLPLNGNSDSVRLFSKIYHDFIYGPGYNPYEPLQNFTSANFFLATPNKFFVGSNFNRDPEYYTMKLLHDNEKTIVSSEELPSFDRNWKSLQNGTILEINRK